MTYRIFRTFLVTISVFTALSCKDRVAESQIAAQVGGSVLLNADVRLQVPLGLKGEDSLAFVNNFIDEWINAQIMYEQGVRNLPDLDKLNQQVEDYRQLLIAQTYENEMLQQLIPANISEEESLEFYEKNKGQIRLDQPVIQGVFVKVLRNSSKVNDIKKWLKKLNDGDRDCIEEFDQYGMHYAADYDNFFDTWVNLYRLSDKLPETIADAASFLKCKTFEMKDADFWYLFVIKDFRLTGDVAPYEYAKGDIYESMAQHRRKEMRVKLLEELRDDGLKSGFVKKY